MVAADRVLLQKLSEADVARMSTGTIVRRKVATEISELNKQIGALGRRCYCSPGAEPTIFRPKKGHFLKIVVHVL